MRISDWSSDVCSSDLLAVGGAGRNWPVRASCQSRARGATVVAMAEENFLSQVPAASALFLREAEVRRGIEYLFFGHAALWRTIDARLAENSLGRAHYRALSFIARAPAIGRANV